MLDPLSAGKIYEQMISVYPFYDFMVHCNKKKIIEYNQLLKIFAVSVVIVTYYQSSCYAFMKRIYQ